MIASAYTDTKMKIGCIFGTGCNAAYMENCGSIPKLAHMNLPADTPMAINCEWGAFDNEHKVLPRTKYDIIVDKDSPRPGQQAFEKMIAGLYLGEIFRLIMVDLHDNHESGIFSGQDISKLRKAYSLDSSFLSAIEEYVCRTGRSFFYSVFRNASSAFASALRHLINCSVHVLFLVSFKMTFLRLFSLPLLFIDLAKTYSRPRC